MTTRKPLEGSLIRLQKDYEACFVEPKNKQIKDLTTKELAAFIHSIVEMTSIDKAKMPSDKAIGFIVAYMASSLPFWTQRQVYRAFIKSFEDKVSHYGQFSLEYVTMVIEGYKATRNKSMSLIIKDQETVKMIENKISLGEIIIKAREQAAANNEFLNFYGRSKDVLRKLELDGEISITLEDKRKIYTRFLNMGNKYKVTAMGFSEQEKVLARSGSVLFCLDCFFRKNATKGQDMLNLLPLFRGFRK